MFNDKSIICCIRCILHVHVQRNCYESGYWELNLCYGTQVRQVGLSGSIYKVEWESEEAYAHLIICFSCSFLYHSLFLVLYS